MNLNLSITITHPEGAADLTYESDLSEVSLPVLSIQFGEEEAITHELPFQFNTEGNYSKEEIARDQYTTNQILEAIDTKIIETYNPAE
jgi:hypothetical protein